MKKLFPLFLLSLLLLVGCRSALTEEGKPCHPLSADEVQTLVEGTRHSLLNPKLRMITPGDRKRLNDPNFMPQFDIRYTGDKAGVAKIQWKLEKNIVIVYYEGDLTSKSPRARMTVEPIYTDADTVFFR